MARSFISGGTAIRLSILGLVSVMALLIVYTENHAKDKYEGVYEAVAKEPNVKMAKVRELAGQDPSETELRGQFLIEKYVFSTVLGRKYVYFAVYENQSEPRLVCGHYKDELPYWLGRERPDVKSYEGGSEEPLVDLIDIVDRKKFRKDLERIRGGKRVDNSPRKKAPVSSRPSADGK